MLQSKCAIIVGEITPDLKLIEYQLSNFGYEIILEAKSSCEVLMLCNRYNVDLIILSLAIQEMNAISILRQLSIIRYIGVIILITGSDENLAVNVERSGISWGLCMLGILTKSTLTVDIKKILQNISQKPYLKIVERKTCISVDELCYAIDNDFIIPWFQPKVSFKTGEWLGTEALARWYHTEKGFIAPSEFILLAEENGLINKLTVNMIYKVFKSAHTWMNSDLIDNLSINLSTQSLLIPGLLDLILSCCQQSRISPQRITFEITESGLIRDVEHSLEVLSNMRLHGFGLSIDDFGTGYSSIQQLTILPFTELKLDKYFISRLNQSVSCRAIVKYSINLAHQLGLKSVAEGVENEDTWRTLAEFGCDMCQGYFTGYPMPSHELGHWHKKWENKFCNLKNTKHLII